MCAGLRGLHPHLGVAALLVADEHEWDAVHVADAADNGGVIQTSPVTVQLDELVCDVEDDVKAGGAIGVAGHLEALHWREPAVRLLAELQSRSKAQAGAGAMSLRL